VQVLLLLSLPPLLPLSSSVDWLVPLLFSS